MVDKNFYHIDGDDDGLVWYVPRSINEQAVPYCKEHTIPLSHFPKTSTLSTILVCPHDGYKFIMRNRYDIHREYVKSMITRENLRDYKILYIEADGNRVLQREKYDKDPNYFIDVKLSDTPKGLQLMVQAGKKDHDGKKVQLFVEPVNERIGFDKSDKDKHPSGLFTEVTAIFKNSKTQIKSKK